MELSYWYPRIFAPILNKIEEMHYSKLSDSVRRHILAMVVSLMVRIEMFSLQTMQYIVDEVAARCHTAIWTYTDYWWSTVLHRQSV